MAMMKKRVKKDIFVKLKESITFAVPVWKVDFLKHKIGSGLTSQQVLGHFGHEEIAFITDDEVIEYAPDWELIQVLGPWGLGYVYIGHLEEVIDWQSRMKEVSGTVV